MHFPLHEQVDPMPRENKADLPFPILPGGTVTFLFTDIEGSTKLLKRLREQYSTLLDEQRELLRSAFADRGGHVVDARGEEFFIAFPRATDAVAAAVDAQRGLSVHVWPEELDVRVRMGLHTGEPWLAEESYVGMDVHRAARIANVGHGGQVLLSETTAALVMDELPEGVTLLDLGRHRLKDVPRMERIRQVVIEGLPSEFPLLKSLEAQLPEAKKPRHNLPTELTPFIGREDELVEISNNLNDPSVRLLTLIGVGGMGKTRLALHIAADKVDVYPDGVWLVEFARLRDPDLVPQYAAAALGVSAHDAVEGQDVGDVLISYLEDKSLLLLLDNCEHLIEACASLAERLLKECPQVQLLATSRENLGTPGEHTFNVPAMDVPLEIPELRELETCEATRFFIDRAKAALPMFKPTVENTLPIVEICRRLDGIPLAIELAAARVKILAPEQITELLQDRFQLLTGGPRTALPRHQTLQATLEWSYNLLTEPEQTLFSRLSVFSGGWTLEAVDGLLAEDGLSRTDLLELLSNLVDKSLVIVSHRQDEARYGMLETVHQYATELLSTSGETEAYRRRHANYLISLAEEGDPKLRSADQITWLRKFDDEHENFRAALRWTTASDHADDAARLVAALGWFWFLRGYWTDARQWLNTSMDMVSDPEPLLRAKAICRAAGIELIQGNLAGPPELVREALDIFTAHEDIEGMAWCLNLLGQTASFVTDDDVDCIKNLNQSLELFRSLGDNWGMAWSKRYLGQMAEFEGDIDRAFALQEEALKVFKEIGDFWNAAHSRFLIGGTYRDQGDFQKAESAYRESYAMCETIDDHVMGAHALQGMGIAALELERYRDAEVYLQDALEIMERIGDENCTSRANYYLARVALHHRDFDQALAYLRDSMLMYKKLNREAYIAMCLIPCAELTSTIGQHRRAAQLLGAVYSFSFDPLAAFPVSLQEEYQGQVEETRELLGEDEFKRAYNEGTKLTVDEVLACALGADETF
jgi:predicted ATPase/class 3 adenylate cyclase